ncbi:MAG TPA: WhiB family transcriptional regulator [Pseudonocardia sp.]
MTAHLHRGTAPARLTGAPPAWVTQAACATIAPELRDVFYPEQRAEGAHAAICTAKRICRGCPVQRECLEFGDLISPRDGLWGGLTASERRSRRAELRGAA